MLDLGVMHTGSEFSFVDFACQNVFDRWPAVAYQANTAERMNMKVMH
jgi:hypothetical protein